MNEPTNCPPGPQERAEALVMAAFLRATLQVLGGWSLGASLLATGALAFTQPVGWLMAPWCGVMLLGLLERYLALRLALDQSLFERLGCGQVADGPSLDMALAQAGLRAQPEGNRPWGDRIRGARGLHRQYLLAVGLQTGALFFSIWMDFIS